MCFKKCIAFFITIALVIQGIPYMVGAAVLPLEQFDYEKNGDSICITGYNGSNSDVVIEDAYIIDGKMYEVTAIGDSAFEEAEMSSLTLPETLTSIGEAAFYNCDNLTKVVIPETVTNISQYAFDDCNALIDVTVLNAKAVIGESAFGYYYAGRNKYYLVENFVMCGFANSTAQKYAEENDIEFKKYIKPPVCDVNLDGVYDARDLVRLKKILAGSISAQGSNPDVNKDGKCSSEDLVCARNVLISGEENLKKYTVIFKDSDGNIISNQKVLHMFSAIAPEAPEKDGYMFTGWSDSFTCIDKDKVITAIYKEDKEPRLIVNSVQATSGDKGVRVAVVLKNNPAILGMTLSLEYNEDVMSLVGVSNGEAMEGILNFTPSNVLKSGCRFVWDGQEISAKDVKNGTILYLDFDINKNVEKGTYPINISYNKGEIIDGELNTVSIKIENGNIVIF